MTAVPGPHAQRDSSTKAAPVTTAPDGTLEGVVRRVERLTPRLLRVRLGELGRQGWRSTGVPDEYVPVVFPPSRAPTDRRIYTAAAWDEAADELALDIVDHPGGLACGWAATAEPGERLLIGGPRATFAPPTDASRYVLAGDATALPAIRRILASLPASVSAHAVVEVTDEADRLPLPTAATLCVSWLHTDSTTSPSRLPAALAPAGPPSTEPAEPDQAADDATYWWVAGEAAATRAIRRHLRQVREVPREYWTVFGYWRRQSEHWRRTYAGVEAAAMAAVERAMWAGRSGEELMDVYDDVLDAALTESSDIDPSTDPAD